MASLPRGVGITLQPKDEASSRYRQSPGGPWMRQAQLPERGSKPLWDGVGGGGEEGRAAPGQELGVPPREVGAS